MLSVFNLISRVVLVLLCDAFVVLVLSDKPRENQGRGLVDHKLVTPPCLPSNFIAGRPKAALLFWFFSDFKCSVPLSLFLLYMNIKIGKNSINC